MLKRTIGIGMLAFALFVFTAPGQVFAQAKKKLKVGDTGPGGGKVYSVLETSRGYKIGEVSPHLGVATYEDALKIVKDYRGGGYSDWEMPIDITVKLIYKQLGSKRGFRDWYWARELSLSRWVGIGFNFTTGKLDIGSVQSQKFGVLAIRDCEVDK